MEAHRLPIQTAVACTLAGIAAIFIVTVGMDAITTAAAAAMPIAATTSGSATGQSGAPAILGGYHRPTTPA